MAKSARHRTYATKHRYDISSGHTLDVRLVRPASIEKETAVQATVGERLIALRERAGLSLAEVARLAGYKGASSIQKLFKADYNPKELQALVADRLARALVGKGMPEIKKSELMALAGRGESLDALLADLTHYNYLASAFIGLHRTRRVMNIVKSQSGVELPMFVREDMSRGIPYHPCPPFLRPRGVIGLYLSVGYMWPRFEEGEPIFYEHDKPPKRGDDVLVFIKCDLDLDGAMVIGRLAVLNDKEVHLDLLNPADKVVLPRSDVSSVRRVMHTTDFLEPVAYAGAP